MNRQIMRIAGANLGGGMPHLLQGCGMFERARSHREQGFPGDLPPVEVQIMGQAASASPVEVVPTTRATCRAAAGGEYNATIPEGRRFLRWPTSTARWQDVVAVNPGSRRTVCVSVK